MASWYELGIDTRGKVSGQIKTRCPRCGPLRKKPHDPCLSVNLDTGSWSCHNPGCGFTGDKFEELGARSSYGSRLTPAERTAPAKQYTKPRPIANEASLGDGGAKFFSDRGIKAEIARDAGVTSSRVRYPDQGQGEPPLGSVLFPYYRDGELVNIKFRSAERKTHKMVGGAELIWYGLDWCRDADLVVVTEGEFDALVCRQVGYREVMSVPNGAPGPNAKSSEFRYFESGKHIFDRAATVILATDADGPGEHLAQELARRIGPGKCYRVNYPDGCKDLNDVLLRLGESAVIDALRSAAALPVEGVITPRDLIDRTLHYVKYGLDAGVVMRRFPSLSHLFRPALGQLTTIVGIPGHGKSQFVDTLMLELIKEAGWPFGVFSPENYPPELYLSHLCQKLYRKPLRSVVDPNTGRELVGLTDQEIIDGIEYLDEYVKLILPDDPTPTEVIERAKDLIGRSGIKALVIDPWTELAHDPSRMQTEHQYIGKQVTMIRQFLRDFVLHGFLVVHPTKLPAIRSPNGQEQARRPGAYDIAGSSHFANKSDNIISIFRDTDDDEAAVEASVIKVRFRENGKRGTAPLYFDPVTTCYTDGREETMSDGYSS